MTLRILASRSVEEVEAVHKALHPNGPCSCHGEGTCGRCRSTCCICGSTEENPIHKAQTCGEPFGFLDSPREDKGADGKGFCQKFVGHSGPCGYEEYGPHSFIPMSGEHIED